MNQPTHNKIPSQYRSAMSTASDGVEAVAHACDEAMRETSGPPSLALLFVSPHHAEHLERISQVCRQRIGTDSLLGCTGESIVGGPREIEQQPAVAVWLAWWSGEIAGPMHLQFERTPEVGAIVGWHEALTETWPEEATMLVLGEPFSFPADYLLQRLNEDHPTAQVLGGMASGGMAPGENRIVGGDRVYQDGAVAVRLSGVPIHAVVSQGCRPIGEPFVITQAERNVIYQLGGRPAVQRLKEVFDGLPNREKELVRHGLHLGRVVSEYQDHFESGDFLVRNVTSLDTDDGSLAIGDYVRPGQTVQFHLRDRETAHDDLVHLLQKKQQTLAAAPRGALLFTCNGRGTRLFEQPDHDAATVAEIFEGIPTAGFFAQGELGPIGGKNFVHGFTACVALFA